MQMRFLLVMISVFIFVQPAYAQKAVDTDTANLKSAVNLDLCRFMTSHQSLLSTEDVVSAEYQSGVDVKGKPVVEADLSSGVNLPDINTLMHKFNLELDVLGYLGIENTTAHKIVTNYATVMSYEGRYYISFGIEKQGGIAAYQQILGSDQEAALQALCPKELPAKKNKTAKTTNTRQGENVKSNALDQDHLPIDLKSSDKVPVSLP